MTPTRSRAACNSCRSRKQKCDETKPKCSRCRVLGQPCVWPAGKKRGPAKGYTEALEHRLRETEAALLRLWNASSSEAIERAFARDGEVSKREITPGEGSPGASLAKAGLITKWEEYPLNSARDIQRWAAEMVGPVREKQVGVSAVKESRTIGPQLTPTREQTFQPDPPQVTLPTASETDAELQGTREALSGGTLPSALQEVIDVRERIQGLGTGLQSPGRRFQLPEEFRQQYLW